MFFNRIKHKFAKIREEGKVGLLLFLTAGFPDLETTEKMIPALIDAGADGIEIGVPFSDPLADGATIQASSFHALEQGVSLKDCLDLVSRLRKKIPETPLILFGYYNPIFAYGLEDFGRDAQLAGVDGLIVPDLPIEEAEPLNSQCKFTGMDLIQLLTPTSTEERIRMVCRDASGFIYCVSVAGVTGAREALPSEVSDMVKRIRKHTDLPLGVGFGVSTKEHLKYVSQNADAAIVGSALIRAIGGSVGDEAVSKAVNFVKTLRGTG